MINSYQKAIQYLNEKKSLGVMPGLERIKAALEEKGNPQNDFKIIHIAGTNGKGTVAATISKALENNGFRVGLFTTPWVVSCREQIQLCGEMISCEDFTRLTDECQNDVCTEFETLVLMAYLFFSRNKVDYAVVECGMGGLGDATNVENDNLSVITPISFDHTDYFGSSIEDIAKEKAGILRKSCDCIIYSDEFKDIFAPHCKKLYISPDKDNLSLVNTVLDYLGINAVSELVRLPARQERIGSILLDGGHNKSAGEYLSKVIENETALIGMLKDKDVDAYLSFVAPKCKKIITVTPKSERAMDSKELLVYAKRYCNDVISYNDINEALNDFSITLVCGSFYLAREIRKILI
ncbi:MAG: hypothetical protein IJT65_05310 [Eubacterium sp.]|nr:hypothetical protein [Eubacterium sp.]